MSANDQINNKQSIAGEVGKNTIFPVSGIRLATAAAGTKYQDRDDVAIIEIAPDSSVAAVFTKNAFCAAPVQIAREHIAKTTPQYLVINAGNANAGTGQQGYANGLEICTVVAKTASAPVETVLPFSTGVIGEQLQVDSITALVPTIFSSLNEQGWEAAAAAILTTDLVTKIASTKVDIDGTEVTITGIAKGSGMIRPDMATMLAFVATDVKIKPEVLQNLLKESVSESFNRITVDGDTSTNDACILIATGKIDDIYINKTDSETARKFLQGLIQICKSLALKIVSDGEGATKLVRVLVKEGKNADECFNVAYTVAHSPLVKTALFASDPNWGRILAAVGRADVDTLDINKISIFLDHVCVIEKGVPAEKYTEMDGNEIMQQSALTIEIRLGRGTIAEHIWTTDLSYDYVKINAEYRT